MRSPNTYRVNVQKTAESVAAEFAAHRKKRDERGKARTNGKAAISKTTRKRPE